MRSPWVRVTLLFLLTTSPNLSTQVAGQRSRTLSPPKWLETAHTLFVQGDFPKARLLYAECLPTFARLGSRWWLSHILAGFANLAAHQQQPLRAARLIGATMIGSGPPS